MSMKCSPADGLNADDWYPSSNCSTLKLLCGDGTPLESGGEGGRIRGYSCLIVVYSTEGQGDGELWVVVAGEIGDINEDGWR